MNITERRKDAAGRLRFSLAEAGYEPCDTAVPEPGCRCMFCAVRLLETPLHEQQGLSLEKPLSQKEIEALELFSKGFPTNEAADQLGISINTMRERIKSILVKTETSSRLEAVVIALKLGLIR